MSAPISAFRLMEVIAGAQAALDRLREEDGLVLETEDELRQALAEEGLNVDAVLSRIGRAALDAAAMVEMIESRMEALSTRLKRFERRNATLRATLLQALQALGMKSFSDPEFDASVRNGKPKVIVTDVDALPPDCVRVTRTPDKTHIGWLLRDHGPVPGATLSNAENYIQIGSK